MDSIVSHANRHLKVGRLDAYVPRGNEAIDIVANAIRVSIDSCYGDEARRSGIRRHGNAIDHVWIAWRHRGRCRWWGGCVSTTATALQGKEKQKQSTAEAAHIDSPNVWHAASGAMVAS